MNIRFEYFISISLSSTFYMKKQQVLQIEWNVNILLHVPLAFFLHESRHNNYKRCRWRSLFQLVIIYKVRIFSIKTLVSMEKCIHFFLSVCWSAKRKFIMKNKIKKNKTKQKHFFWPFYRKWNLNQSWREKFSFPTQWIFLYVFPAFERVISISISISLYLSISVSLLVHHFTAVYDGRDENRTELKERKDSHGSKRLSNLCLRLEHEVSQRKHAFIFFFSNWVIYCENWRKNISPRNVIGCPFKVSEREREKDKENAVINHLRCHSNLLKCCVLCIVQWMLFLLFDSYFFFFFIILYLLTYIKRFSIKKKRLSLRVNIIRQLHATWSGKRTNMARRFSASE